MKKIKEFFKKTLKELKRYYFYKAAIKHIVIRYLMCLILMLLSLYIWQYDFIHEALIDFFQGDKSNSIQIITLIFEMATSILAIIILYFFYNLDDEAIKYSLKRRSLNFFIIVEILLLFCIWQYDLLYDLILTIKKAFIDVFQAQKPDSNKIISTTVEIVTFILAIIGLSFFYLRISKQEKQINLQITQRVDERFNDAIKLLASNESSARTGGIYALYHLFIDDKKSKYREQIGKVLCSHIRSKTQEVEYQKLHKKRPSNEIQTCIYLLFKKGNLYDKYRADLDNADLSHAYLVGADFSSAECQNTIFYFAKCQGACFRFANCQVANFVEANCQGVNFYNTKMQGVKFANTQMQGTYTLKDKNYFLENRIGKDTQLKDIIFTGALDRKDIKAIKKVKYLYRETYQRLQNANKANKGKKPSNKIPKDIAKNIITGKLENSKEIRKIIAESKKPENK